MEPTCSNAGGSPSGGAGGPSSGVCRASIASVSCGLVLPSGSMPSASASSTSCFLLGSDTLLLSTSEPAAACNIRFPLRPLVMRYPSAEAPTSPGGARQHHHPHGG